MTARRPRVLLVTAPYHSGVVESAGVWMPLNFAYVAAAARRAGAEVEIYDAMSLFASHDDIRKKIESFKPDLLGTTAGLSLYPARLFRSGPCGYETIHLAAPKLSQHEDRIQHFVNCVLDGKKPLVPVEESLKVQEILDAIYESAASGKEVKIG